MYVSGCLCNIVRNMPPNFTKSTYLGSLNTFKIMNIFFVKYSVASLAIKRAKYPKAYKNNEQLKHNRVVKNPPAYAYSNRYQLIYPV